MFPEAALGDSIHVTFYVDGTLGHCSGSPFVKPSSCLSLLGRTQLDFCRNCIGTPGRVSADQQHRRWRCPFSSEQLEEEVEVRGLN